MRTTSVVEPREHSHSDASRMATLVSLATSQQHGWGKVVARIVQVQRAGVFAFRCASHCINWHLQGSVRVRWQHGRHDHTRQSRPGCITIVPAGDRHRFEVSGPCKFLNWVLDPQWIESLARQEAAFTGRGLELQPLLAGCDPGLWKLAEALVRELDHPGLGSRLYAESLEVGLIVGLLRRHAPAAQHTATLGGNLPGFKLRASLDFIQANLANPISLANLAEAAGLSRYHFAKLFKRSTGHSPHRYVLEQRVEKAKLLLEEGDLSLAETALSAGFASQSHMTAVFRRLVGVTPGVFQKACG